MALFDQIAFFDAEHNPDVKQAIQNAQQNNASVKLLFWALFTFQGKTVLIQSAPGRWQAINIDSIPVNGIQIRMSQNLWDELPSHQAFLKWCSSMLGARVDDWICFNVIYYAGPSLPLNFWELQYAFLQDKYVGGVDQHYLDIRGII